MKDTNKKLIMTLLVRNEEDIIESCIEFHLKQGVDFIVATDNGSTDDTRNILLKYQKLGLLHLIDEEEHNYNQEVWVNNMIKIARDQFKAHWIMNVDADEFWYSNQGNLKTTLAKLNKYNVVKVAGFQLDPVDNYEGKLFKIPKNLSGRIAPNFKVIHTAKGYKEIKMGNHEVKMKRLNRKKVSTSQIIIYHFAFRSYQHYEQKVIMGTKALNNNPKYANAKHIGRHTRDNYQKYLDGTLRQAYDLVKETNQKSPLYIKYDSKLYDFINNGYKSIDSVLEVEQNNKK